MVVYVPVNFYEQHAFDDSTALQTQSTEVGKWVEDKYIHVTIQGKAGQMEALKSANFERKSAALAKWDSNPESPVFTDVALLTNAAQYIIQTC